MQSPDRKPRPFAAKTVQLHLNLLHDVFKTAIAEELVEANPVDGAERPKVRRKRWRILQPNEVGRVLNAFTDEQARTMFLTLMLTGVRRFELLALRWRDVSFVENTLRVAESKSEEGERLIALSPTLADALAVHYRRTAFKGDDEFVFCHQERGSRVYEGWYTERFRAALKAAGITDYIRPFHDARHASLTNGAAAGETPIALMTRAGHRSMSTTKGYLHLAGVVFRDEARALEQRLLGGSGPRESEQDVRLPGVAVRVGRDEGDDVAAAEVILDRRVDPELHLGRVTEAEVRPAHGLDVDVVDDHPVESSTDLSAPQVISQHPTSHEKRHQT